LLALLLMLLEMGWEHLPAPPAAGAARTGAAAPSMRGAAATEQRG